MEDDVEDTVVGGVREDAADNDARLTEERSERAMSTVSNQFTAPPISGVYFRVSNLGQAGI